MIKKLIKHGNSYAMVIDKAILESLKVTPETPFEITCDGRSIVLTPVLDADREKKFNDAVARVHKRFGDDLQRMAE